MADPEQIFEQVVDSDGNPQQGINGGLNTIMEKLIEIQNKVNEIDGKLNSSLEVYTESQHAREG